MIVIVTFSELAQVGACLQANIQFPVCARVCVLYSLQILPKSTNKLDFLFDMFAFVVIQSQKLMLRHVSVLHVPN